MKISKFYIFGVNFYLCVNLIYHYRKTSKMCFEVVKDKLQKVCFKIS